MNRMNHDRKPHRMTQSELDRILELAQAGEIAAAIAVAIGRSEKGVEAYLRRSGIRAKYPSRAMIVLAERRERICQMYRDGMSFPEIAEAIGYDRSAVRRIAQAGGAHIPDPKMQQAQKRSVGRPKKEPPPPKIIGPRLARPAWFVEALQPQARR